MSFTSFLAQVGRIAFGYLGGFILFITAALMMGAGYTKLGAITFFAGIILMLFGVYSERGL